MHPGALRLCVAFGAARRETFHGKRLDRESDPIYAEIKIRRHEAQLSISQLVRYGVVVPEPERLMDPVLRGVDVLLEDEALVDQLERDLAT